MAEAQQGAGNANRLIYSYEAGKKYCAYIGLAWDDGFVGIADAHFAAVELTQDQVDNLLCVHAWHVKHLFTPANYSWRQRLGLALYWLFGGSR